MSRVPLNTSFPNAFVGNPEGIDFKITGFPTEAFGNDERKFLESAIKRLDNMLAICYSLREMIISLFKRSIFGLLLLLLSPLFLLSPTFGEESASSTKEYDQRMTKGAAFFNAGRYDQAKAEFIMALSVLPNDSQARYQKGVTEGRLGKFSDAEEDLLAVLNMDNPISAAYTDLGIVYYRQKKYQQALSVLERGEKVVAYDPLLYFYEGKVYQEMGNYDIAAARFLRSATIAQDEGSEIYIAARYHAGVSYYQQKHYEDAKGEFLEVAEKEPSSEMGKSSRKFLALIAKQNKNDRRWSLFVSGGIQNDSNVVVSPEDAAFDEAISKKADSRLVTILSGNYRFRDNAPLRINGGYLFYQSLHSDMSKFNAQVHQPSLTATWKKGGKVRRLDYTFGYTTVDQERYLVSHTLRPTLLWTSSSNIQRSVFYQLQRKDFIDSTTFLINSERDGTNQAIGVEASRQKDRRLAGVAPLWKMGYTVDMENVRSADWEYVGHKVNGGTQVSLSARLSGEMGLEYARRAYRDLNRFATPPFSIKRADNVFVANAGVSYEINPKSDLSIGYSFTHNGSNIALFDYRRNILSLNVTGRF